MTFQVFIAYGGNQAKNIAEKLGEYLERIGISTFVASSKFGKWLIPGQHGFKQKIWDKLQESDIMVLVSTRKTAYSKKVKEEVLDAISKGKPVLVLRENNTNIPFSKSLREFYWIPDDLCFDISHPCKIFPEVAIHILRNMEQLAEDRLQTAPLLEEINHE